MWDAILWSYFMHCMSVSKELKTSKYEWPVEGLSFLKFVSHCFHAALKNPCFQIRSQKGLSCIVFCPNTHFVCKILQWWQNIETNIEKHIFPSAQFVASVPHTHEIASQFPLTHLFNEIMIRLLRLLLYLLLLSLTHSGKSSLPCYKVDIFGL